MDGANANARKVRLEEAHFQLTGHMDMHVLMISDSIYRYFDSLSERVAYNLKFNEQENDCLFRHRMSLNGSCLFEQPESRAGKAYSFGSDAQPLLW